MKLENERRVLQKEIQTKFGVVLQWYENLKNPRCYREDVSIHGFFVPPDSGLTEETKQAIRRWVENRGWQFSRQFEMNEAIPNRPIERIYLAPMIFVELEIGYHATRRASLSSIQANGLLPSTPDRQTTKKRADCEGNIYICSALGTLADAGVSGARSAHWMARSFGY